MRTIGPSLLFLVLKLHTCVVSRFTQNNFCAIPFMYRDGIAPDSYVHTELGDSGITVFCNLTDSHSDCSSRGLEHVPKHLPTNIVHLNLWNNSISDIANFTFQRYPALQSLNIGYNSLTTLHVDSFVNLTRLKSLNLAKNKLLMNSVTFPVGVFRPLKSLQSLCMQHNNDLDDPSANYPGEALSDLISLKFLQMDGLPLNPQLYPERGFGPDFLNLTFLQYVSLEGQPGGSCKIEAIQDDTFMNLPNLVYLNLANCYIEIPPNSYSMFSYLTHLQILDLSWNDNLEFSLMSQILHQDMKNLTHLNIGYIVSRYSFGICLRARDVEHLPRSLLYLDLSGNTIVTICPEVFDSLPPNLTSLDLGNNRLVFGSYLQFMHKLENLQSLYLDNDNNVFKIPTKYPPSSYQATECVCSLSSPIAMDLANSSIVFLLPPKLKLFSSNNYDLNYALTALKINPNNSLETLNLDNNNLPVMLGPFLGFSALKTLSVVNSRVEYIKTGFFSNFTSLVSLNLSSNVIGIGLSYKPQDRIFQGLENLKLLYLSFNAIENLYESPKLFEDLHQLEELYLQKNRFWNFDVEIYHMKKLRVLDLSDTWLFSLPIHVRDHIDNLTKSGIAFKLDMSRNPIWCTCDNLDFIEWIVDHRHIFAHIESDHYRCAFHNNTSTRINDGFERIVHCLRRQCKSRVGLFVCVLLATLVVSSILVALVVYRYRWKLRYFYYAVYLSITAKKSFSKKSDEFPYDVFVVYAADDETFIMETLLPELEKRYLKLLVHGRDFVAGDFIASNIVTAVKDSRKTLIVLTQAMVASKWCNYELQMANVEAVVTGRSILVFLQKEPIPNGVMGQKLLCHLQNNTYISYPEIKEHCPGNNYQLKMFWNKLSNDLSH